MNELIRIQTTESGQAVSARELHEKLEMSQHFTDWFKYQIEKMGLEQDKDFITILGESTGGRPSQDYAISLDTAKHMAMMSGGKNARELREYFIEVEKAWNSPEAVMARAQQIAQRTIENLTKNIRVLQPKADQFDKFISGENYQDMNTAAKALGYGRNKLFAELRERAILMSGNRPYQSYIDRGYFVVKEKPISMGGTVFNKPQTYVTAKGLSWLEKTLSKEAVSC